MSPLDQIREVYNSLPSLNCKGLCWNSCGPIDMSDTERARITELGTEIQVFTEERAARWAANERLYCNALSLGAQGEGKPGCTVYEDRPLICRLWGMTDSMPCPYGCEPSERLSDKESYALVFKVMRIGGHHLNGGLDEATFMSLMDNPAVAEAVGRFLNDLGTEAEREEARAAIIKLVG